MTRLTLIASIVTTSFALSACNPIAGAGGDGTPAGGIKALASGRTCPLAVPERDTLLASALIGEDRPTIDAFLEARPQDAVGQALVAYLDGERVVDPDQMACLAPYL